MYRGFDVELDIDRIKKDYDERLIDEDYKAIDSKVKIGLKKLLSEQEELNGSQMQEDWFPQIDADVFISHSHQDLEAAKTLAEWINCHFGLRVFVDAFVWGNFEELQKEIDNRFCQSGEDLYSYQKRNQSTSHVHMMLSTALYKMMDKTECLFFLNTPNSITTEEVVERTESPWIYGELTMSKFIRKKAIGKHRDSGNRSFAKGYTNLRESVKIEHQVNLDHLTKMNTVDLLCWKDSYHENEHPLNTLYTLLQRKKQKLNG